MTRQSISIVALEDFVARCLSKGGFPAATADEVAAHLLEAEMCGVSSHGIMRMSYYLDLVSAGELRCDAMPLAERKDSSLWTVDGGGGLGIPAMNLAVDCLVETSKMAALGAVAVTNTGHTGRIGSFVARAAREGLFTLCLGGGGGRKWANVAPFGGRDPVISTNPYSLSMPNGTDRPPYVDFAISAIATGKVNAARLQGELLPEGAMIDREGNPTRDPEALANGGALLPAAGPKGSGLGLIAELVGSTMLGPALEFNWLVIGIRADALRGGEEVFASALAFEEQVRSSRPAAGHSAVRMPGDVEYENFQRRRDAAAIEVNAGVLARLKASAVALGEKVPWERP